MNKNKLEFYCERAKLDFDYEEYQLTIEDADAALELCTDSKNNLNYKGKMYELKTIAYYRLEDYDNALKFANLTQELIFSKDAYQVKSLILDKRGEYDGVISTIRKMLKEKLSNDPYREQSRIAFAYYKLGKYQESINEHEKCFELTEDKTLYVQTWGFIGEMYEKLGQLDQAEIAYKNSLEAHACKVSYNLLAWFYYESKQDFEKALDYVNKALICNPKDGDSLDTRANIYNAIGEYDKALADINYSIELKPTPIHYKTRAKIYENLNEPAKAKEDLAKAKN